jgi:hypothetical protein
MGVHVYNLWPIDLRSQYEPAFAAYPMTFIRELYLKRPYLDKIDPAGLSDFLQLAGAIYLYQREAVSNGRAEAPNWRDKERQRAQLAKIAKTASQLSSQLAQLDEPAAALMWLPLRDQITQLVSSNPDKFGAEIGHYKDGETVPAFLLNEEHLLKALRVIETLAQDAREILPEEKGGRPDHPGLKRWLETLHAYWTGRLGQKFTLTFGDLGPSPAVRFFTDVMAPLDADIEQATLYSAMLGLRSELRQRTKRDTLSAKTLNQSFGVIPIHMG